MNIDPQAWTSVTGGDRTRFPAQVRVDIVEKCAPLKEADFAHVFPAYGRLPSEMTHDEVQELNACFDKKAAARKGPPKQQPPRQPETPQRQQPHPAPQRQQQQQPAPAARPAARPAADATAAEREEAELARVLEESRRTAQVDNERRTMATGRPPPPSELPATAARHVPQARGAAPAQAPRVTASGNGAVLSVDVKKQLEMCAAAVAACRKEVDYLRGWKRDAEAELKRLREAVGGADPAQATELQRAQADMRADIDELKAQLAAMSSGEVMAAPAAVAATPVAADGWQNDTKLMVVGGLGMSGTLNSAELIDPATGQREALPPMTMQRSNMSLVNVRNGLGVCVVGGGRGADWFSAVERYDFQAQRWMEMPSMLSARFSGGATALPNGDMMAGGGGAGKSSLLDTTEILHLGADRWIEAAPLSEKRFATALASARGAVWAVGGFSGKTYLTTVEYFDPREGRWHAAPKMNLKRGGHSIASTVMPGAGDPYGEDALLAFGGYDGSGPMASVEFLDLRQLGAWQQMEEMSSPRSYGAAARLGDTIYAIGGLKAQDMRKMCPIEAYDHASSTWGVVEVFGGDVPVQRHSFGLAAV